MFYLINTVGLYDTLLGIILPTAAFALPICTLILTGTMRDITPELYEAMAVDGAGTWRTFVRLVLPLSKAGHLHDRRLRRAAGAGTASCSR